MIPALLFAAALGSGGVASFKADFPKASALESKAGGRLVHASGFTAPDLGDTPESAARAFLSRYAACFGVTAREELVARTHGQSGRPQALPFERRIDGLPLFDGDVVVGLDAGNAVTLVNSADVPAQVTGRAKISRRGAIRAARAALPGLEGASASRAERGWRAFGDSIRPVWRIDFSAARPPGDWRSYVDAESGSLLMRVDLRASGNRGWGRR